MKHIWKNSALAGVATLATLGLAAANPAMAQSLTGFTNFAAPNGSATLITNGVQLTPATNSQAGSIWSSAVQPVGAWTASFDYQESPAATPTANVADGFTFALQNEGTAALGAGGGNLGFAPGSPGGDITGNDAAAQFNIYNNSSMGFGINGGIDKGHYTPATDILRSGDLIHISLAYANNWVTQTMADATAGTSYAQSFYSNLGTLFAGNGGQAYVGFTGGTGGANAQQQVSNFSFTGQAATVNSVNPAPVAVSGFNVSAVLSTAGQAVTPLDAGGNWAFDTQSYNPGGHGLPDNGAIISTGSSNGGAFQLAPYTGNNALYISTNSTINGYNFPSSGTLKPATDGNYSTIGILSAAADGPVPVSVTFHYKDGTTSVSSLNVNDWYAPVDPVISIDRVGIATNTSGFQGGPGLHEDYFQLTPGETLDSINFTDTYTGTDTNSLAGIFAVNGIVAPAPEPAETLALALGAFGLLGLVARKRRASAS